jgi:putative transcriptional regulator
MKSFAGSFLVARPVLRDPNFERTVVLLLAHNEEGAFGLVVNRPAPPTNLPFPLFLGGPCPSPGLLMLHGQPMWVDEPSPGQEPVPGVYLGDVHALEQATDEEEEDGGSYRVFRGYAGWGEGQLEGELVAGAWALVPASAELLFETPPEELWERLVPPSIPQPSVN